MHDTRYFYRDLPALGTFAEAVKVHLHTPVPGDWWIVVADVIGSTQAIEAGKYKDVNTVGVACITAVLNMNRAIHIPFIFGGDGTTLAIPDFLAEEGKNALRGVQAMAQDGFGLQLRVGLVQVKSLVSGGYWVNIAKVHLSANLTQATFSGFGWEEAERRVKSGSTSDVIFLDSSTGPATANFEGFECRWEAVPQFNGHKLSLLVAAISGDPAINLETYQAVSKAIENIYGEVSNYHPIKEEQLHLSMNAQTLSHEWRVRTLGRSVWQRWKYYVKLRLQNLAGKYLFATGKDTRTVKWSHYRQDLVENSDFRKFDGMLKMVIDGNDAQASDLEAFLKAKYGQGLLVYGIFKSRAALVTCFVQSYNGNHLHFVDGSDGGYAIAAKNLKRQIATAKSGERI